MKKTTLFLALIFLSILSFAQGPPVQRVLAKATPKLVVGIVVDQMRYDYIYRFWNKFGDDGFKRLVGEGLFCRNTNYNYVPTYTGPGHASIYTGTTPSVHGIIGNNWYNAEKKSIVYCSEDKSVQTVGGTSLSGQMSPALLLTTTIGDELKLSNNGKSKVIGIALKDRGAILPAGHSANAAYWLERTTGNWITSSYYMKTLPAWAIAFNAKELAKNYLSKPWTTLLLADQYSESSADDNKYEGKFEGELEPVFPHNLPLLMKSNGGLGLIANTPFGNSITKDFAIEAIRSENLGKGDVTDFVAISFSSTDYIGHQYGVNAVETEDTYLRLDKDLAELLKFIDGYLGKNNVLLFLTADHGAVENSALLIDSKIPAGNIDAPAIADSVKARMFKAYGDSLILAYVNQQFYLNYKIIERKKLNAAMIEKNIADYAIDFNGVASTLTGLVLKNNCFPEGPSRMVQNGYNQKRSGDVAITYEPGWVEIGKTGTTHGTPYSYDTHVPLIWFGSSIIPGVSDESFNITDIAPTLSMILNIPFPSGCSGKPIRSVTGH